MPESGERIELFLRFIKKPGAKFIVIPIYWILFPIIKLIKMIPFVQVMQISFEIEKLEGQEKIEEARALRHSWMEKSRYSQSEELWCSEGKDLLYNKKEYDKALNAFEKSIRTNPCFNPIEVYYGASCAALLTGDHQKAGKNYLIFANWWEKFENDPKLSEYLLGRYSECKKWVESNIVFSEKGLS